MLIAKILYYCHTTGNWNALDVEGSKRSEQMLWLNSSVPISIQIPIWSRLCHNWIFLPVVKLSQWWKSVQVSLYCILTMRYTNQGHGVGLTAGSSLNSNLWLSLCPEWTQQVNKSQVQNHIIRLFNGFMYWNMLMVSLCSSFFYFCINSSLGAQAPFSCWSATG